VNWKAPTYIRGTQAGANDGVVFTQGVQPATTLVTTGPDKVVCRYCKEPGHGVDDCPKLAAKLAREQLNTTGTQLLTAGLRDDGFDDQSGRAKDWLFWQSGGGIPSSWILLDNQSTVDVFSNRGLLKNIRNATTTMQIHCNAGVSHTNQIGDLPGYGTVWFHPRGIANILSLSRVKQKYRVTFDSTNGNQFIIHKPDGTTREFQESSRGLYYHDTNTSASASLLVNTVRNNSSQFTAQEYSQASLARKLQCIIGRPSTKEFLRIVDSNLLPNCPISRADILNAEFIFGPDVGSLKGKTVRRSPHVVRIHPSDVRKPR
jgi:hypothetical protein